MAGPTTVTHSYNIYRCVTVLEFRNTSTFSFWFWFWFYALWMQVALSVLFDARMGCPLKTTKVLFTSVKPTKRISMHTGSDLFWSHLEWWEPSTGFLPLSLSLSLSHTLSRILFSVLPEGKEAVFVSTVSRWRGWPTHFFRWMCVCVGEFL